MTKKKFTTWLVATGMAAATIVPSGSAFGASNPLAGSASSFSDSGQTAANFQKAVQQAAELGLISGDPSGRFRPLDTLTRQELAVLLTRALRIEPVRTDSSSFQDVPTDTWSYPYIEAVKKAGVMLGDGKKFRPGARVTREELAAALMQTVREASVPNNPAEYADQSQVSGWAKPAVRSALALGMMELKGNRFAPRQDVQRQEAAEALVRIVRSSEYAAAIDWTDGRTVSVDGRTYVIGDSLKGLLNAENNLILKGAKIRFGAAGGTINEIRSLEIVQSGENAAAGEAEFSRNVVLDARGDRIEGDVTISGDYVSVKNVTVSGSFEVSQALYHDFYGYDITVQGSTFINGGDTNTVVFENSRLQTVDINKKDVRVDAAGSTTVKDFLIYSNTTLIGEAGTTIDRVTLKDGAEQVDISASVGYLVVSSGAKVNLSAGSSIRQLEVADPAAVLNIRAGAKITDLKLPANADASKIIANYEQVQDRIGSVNGTKPAPTVQPVPTLPTLPVTPPDTAPTPNAPVTPPNTAPTPNAPVTPPDTAPTPDAPVTPPDAAPTPDAPVTPPDAAPIPDAPVTPPDTAPTPDAPVTPPDTAPTPDAPTTPPAENHAPTVANPIGDQTVQEGQPGQEIDLNGVFADEDGDMLTLSAESSNTSAATVSVSPDHKLQITPVGGGSTVIAVTANDGRGASQTATFTLTVNRAPYTANAIADQQARVGEADVTVDLSGVFADADAEELTVSAVSEDPSVAAVKKSEDGSRLIVTPMSAGSVKITVTAADKSGAKATNEFQVVVAPAYHKTPFFSEVDWGSDANQYFEIYNPTNSPIALERVKIAWGEGKEMSLADAESGNSGVTSLPAGSAISISDFLSEDLIDPQLQYFFEIGFDYDRPIEVKLLVDNVVTDSLIFTPNVSAIRKGGIWSGSGAYDASEWNALPYDSSLPDLGMYASDQAPVVAQPIMDVRWEGGADSYEFYLDSVFSSGNKGAELTYTADSSDPGVARVSIAGNSLTVVPLNDGETTVTVTAVQSGGKQVRTTFKVIVSANGGMSG
ncbi:S-layer homology domain-containing protein [Saccharibacillus alkalitolerans]|uniref:SLH domain-containing protein n=1 Tax=Saccharibacillus alkalitolerans TaxID=2705290 RepID=A0ABX0F2J5_9BACL|nr:S-layer homology domain-containing protein [Saccharibacillus alkalitolerans]NGZ74690.1 hypothetical protein [Saccharibacillus alkalitolerans]